MAEIRLQIPNQWRPRQYQLPAWRYLERGGLRCVTPWHRRSGKDSLALNWTACAALDRRANYWHMLPKQEQARKAVWDAVNPHTGTKFIDQAFPLELRKRTLTDTMTIEFYNGSIWQLVGSDNYNSLMGTTPAGIVFSEFSLTKPSAWDYVRPILLENDGWAVFNFTPRGRNHAHRLFTMARKNPAWFCELLTVEDTGFDLRKLDAEREAGMSEEMIQQEYYCSFEAALVGAYYGKYLATCEAEGRIGAVPHDPALEVVPVFDIGRTDATAIWFFQVARNTVRFIDYHESNGKDVGFYCDLLKARGYRYRLDEVWLPHDAKAQTLAAPRSVQMQMEDAGFSVRIVPRQSIRDRIEAAKATLKTCEFDAEGCELGLDMLRLYQQEWDDDKKMFADHPLHDYTSDCADAFGYACIVWEQEMQAREPEAPRWPDQQTFAELVTRMSARHRAEL